MIGCRLSHSRDGQVPTCYRDDKESISRLAHKKMRQAGVIACLIIRASRLVIELQRKLDISRRLRCTDDTGGTGLHGGVRRRKIDAVERIQEVAAELQLEAFGEVEVFLKAEIP